MCTSPTDSDSDMNLSPATISSLSQSINNKFKFPSISELPLSESASYFFNQIQPIIPTALTPQPKATSNTPNSIPFITSLKKTSSHSKSSWSQEEDEVLLNAVSGKSNINWDYIASIDGKHTPKQCRERWLVKLNPDVRRSPFEPWEDELIQNERKKIGNHWSLIAQLLPGRTSCSVKNRWYTVLRYKSSSFPMYSNYPLNSAINAVHRNIIC